MARRFTPAEKLAQLEAERKEVGAAAIKRNRAAYVKALEFREKAQGKLASATDKLSEADAQVFALEAEYADLIEQFGIEDGTDDPGE